MARPPGHSAGYEPRREEIIDRAAMLFAEKGYAATGVSEICTATGLGKGALYHYIGSKESLLVAIQDRVLDPLMAKAKEILAFDTHPVVKLRLLSEALLTSIMTRIDHVWVYEQDYCHLTGDNRERMLAQRKEFEKLVQDAITAAIDQGSLRVMDARLATLQFLNLHNHTYRWAATAKRHWSVQQLSDEYCRTLIRGMASADAQLKGLDDEAARLRELL
jgi:AcrR family transcriptional regulator